MTGVVYAYECESVTKLESVPCEVTTTYALANSCNTYAYTLTLQNGTVIKEDSLSSRNGSSLCFFVFNQSNTGAYYFNTSYSDNGSINVEGDNMFLASLLLVPLLLSFLFVYWGNSLTEEQEALKWFMRFLALIMIFPAFALADIIVTITGGDAYSNLNNFLDITWIAWIFWTVMAVFLVYFVYRIFTAIKMKKNSDFEQGVFSK